MMGSLVAKSLCLEMGMGDLVVGGRGGAPRGMSWGYELSSSIIITYCCCCY